MPPFINDLSRQENHNMKGFFTHKKGTTRKFKGDDLSTTQKFKGYPQPHDYLNCLKKSFKNLNDFFKYKIISRT